jgi:hypothetical protein
MSIHTTPVGIIAGNDDARPLTRKQVIELRDSLLDLMAETFKKIGTSAYHGLDYLEDNLPHAAFEADCVIARADELKGIIRELRLLKWRAFAILKADAAYEAVEVKP